MEDTHRLANGDSAEYWAGVEGGRLLFQKCQSCGMVQFPPRQHCARCWNGNLEWIESAGTGTVESYTIVRRAPLRSFRDRVPYVVASILTAEGPRMIAALTGETALDVAIGDAVSVAFETDGEGAKLPVFHRR